MGVTEVLRALRDVIVESSEETALPNRSRFVPSDDLDAEDEG